MSNNLKPEVYSCLKMMEAFHDRCIKIFNSGNRDYDIATALKKQYKEMCKLLMKHLFPTQFEFIPHMETVISVDADSVGSAIQELATVSSITISYLMSLTGSLDMELERKQKELELKEREVESYKKIIKDSLEVIKEIPEAMRSEVVAKMKKSHRDIEKFSRKNNH